MVQVELNNMYIDIGANNDSEKLWTRKKHGDTRIFTLHITKSFNRKSQSQIDGTLQYLTKWITEFWNRTTRINANRNKYLMLYIFRSIHNQYSSLLQLTALVTMLQTVQLTGFGYW